LTGAGSSSSSSKAGSAAADSSAAGSSTRPSPSASQAGGGDSPSSYATTTDDSEAAAQDETGLIDKHSAAGPAGSGPGIAPAPVAEPQYGAVPASPSLAPAEGPSSEQGSSSDDFAGGWAGGGDWGEESLAVEAPPPPMPEKRFSGSAPGSQTPSAGWAYTVRFLAVSSSFQPTPQQQTCGGGCHSAVQW
jgi:hypothetical protein